MELNHIMHFKISVLLEKENVPLPEQPKDDESNESVKESVQSGTFYICKAKRKKYVCFRLPDPSLFFPATLQFLFAFQKMKIYHTQPTLFVAIFICFASFVVILFLSSLSTGPNRPLFIIYFRQITHLLC